MPETPRTLFEIACAYATGLRCSERARLVEPLGRGEASAARPVVGRGVLARERGGFVAFDPDDAGLRMHRHDQRRHDERQNRAGDEIVRCKDRLRERHLRGGTAHAEHLAHEVLLRVHEQGGARRETCVPEQHRRVRAGTQERIVDRDSARGESATDLASEERARHEAEAPVEPSRDEGERGHEEESLRCGLRDAREAGEEPPRRRARGDRLTGDDDEDDLETELEDLGVPEAARPSHHEGGRGAAVECQPRDLEVAEHECDEREEEHEDERVRHPAPDEALGRAPCAREEGGRDHARTIADFPRAGRVSGTRRLGTCGLRPAEV